ncbi:hypothetical protein JHK87_001805 [Glycine soja]|nr:hypothetical protein JHK87_001805 [Glycine soja]
MYYIPSRTAQDSKGIVVWSANGARWDFGVVGVQSVVSNLVPGLMRKLMFEGKNDTLNSKLMPLNTCWKPPQASVRNDFRLPVTSSAVNNRLI